MSSPVEHRGALGGTILGTGGAALIAAATLGDQTHWRDGTVITLFGVGAACLLAGLVILTGPHRPPKPESAPASRYAETFLKEEGLWPSWWQRMRHPRTPVGQLPVRVPAALREAYRAQRDAIYEFTDELENNRRDLSNEIDHRRAWGIYFPGSAWAKHRHLLNAAKFAGTREAVQDALPPHPRPQ